MCPASVTPLSAYCLIYPQQVPEPEHCIMLDVCDLLPEITGFNFVRYSFFFLFLPASSVPNVEKEDGAWSWSSSVVRATGGFCLSLSSVTDCTGTGSDCPAGVDWGGS